MSTEQEADFRVVLRDRSFPRFGGRWDGRLPSREVVFTPCTDDAQQWADEYVGIIGCKQLRRWPGSGSLQALLDLLDDEGFVLDMEVA